MTKNSRQIQAYALLDRVHKMPGTMKGGFGPAEALVLGLTDGTTKLVSKSQHIQDIAGILNRYAATVTLLNGEADELLPPYWQGHIVAVSIPYGPATSDAIAELRRVEGVMGVGRSLQELIPA